MLPDWRCRPGELERESIWQDRLAALIEYRTAGHDWPRRKRAETDTERELGEWLQGQRFKLGRGTLSTDHATLLDTTLPGWRTGRKRGTKPGTVSASTGPGSTDSMASASNLPMEPAAAPGEDAAPSDGGLP